MDLKVKRELSALWEAESGAGTRISDAPLRMALLYPSPYRVAMSSLGYLQMHRLANLRPQTRCERAMVPDVGDWQHMLDSRTPVLTVEAQRSISDFDVIGVSHAYELELAGLAFGLSASGMPPLSKDRDASHPLVVLGGPITFSNPLPSAAFADMVVMGEGEDLLNLILEHLEERPEYARGSDAHRRTFLELMADVPGIYVPSIHGERLPPIARAEGHLPAFSEIWTPHTELRDMVLIEPERGCHRGCTFCVMRRSTNGGMRLFDPAEVLSRIPADVPRVGLVGAAVSDHPHIKDILRALIDDKGKRIGISSLRADRLDDEFVGLLRRGGYRSMTVALDASSERLRDQIEKNLKNRHIERAAALAKAHTMAHLKVYVVLGLPGETDEDVQELVAFANDLSKTLPITLGVSPFVPKFRTPLAGDDFMGEARAQKVLKHLQRSVGGRVTVRGPSAKEAYVEYRLAQGGLAHGEAAVVAAAGGATLGAWKRALRDLPDRASLPNPDELTPAATKRRRHPLHVVGTDRNVMVA